MVLSIFIRRFPELKVGMNRLRWRLNDEDENDEEASLSPPHIDELPAPLTDSRDPRESPINALAFATMTKLGYDESEMRSSSFEEQRDDKRSAFSNVRTEAVKTEEEEEEEETQSTTTATATATEIVYQQSGDDDTNPVRRPQKESLLYYRPQHHQQQANEDANVQQNQYQRQAYAQPQQYHQNYNPQQYYQRQSIYSMGHYSYPSAHNEHQERYAAAAASERSDLQYPYQPSYPREYGYPQHYPQEYYHEHDYNPLYAYDPSVIAASRLGQYYYPERATTMPSQIPPQPDTLSRTASAVTDSIGKPSMEEDNRKPAAHEQRRSRESRITAMKEEEGTADFEPIPLYQMSAVLSSPLAPSQMFAPKRLTQAFAQSSGGRDMHLAPPIQNVAPTPRTQSCGGSNTSSTGGEGGSWEKRYAELCEFKRIYGHCEVPQAYSDNNSLGFWVNKVRISNCTK